MVIIKMILEVLNISQLEFANQIGVSRQTIFMWLSGYKISAKHLQKISEYYSIPISFLEQSQISGFQLSASDQEYLKKCLINSKSIYNENIINKLLRVIASSNTFKSDNFNNFISNELDYSNIKLVNDNEIDDGDSCHYLVICERNQKDLKEILLDIDALLAKLKRSKVAYIIYDGKENKVSVIRFGGKHETDN